MTTSNTEQREIHSISKTLRVLHSKPCNYFKKPPTWKAASDFPGRNPPRAEREGSQALWERSAQARGLLLDAWNRLYYGAKPTLIVSGGV